MESSTSETAMTFVDYMESLFQELPSELQTDDMKIKLATQANEIVMTTISDHMSEDDLQDMLTMTQEMEIPFENVMSVYLEGHPELFPFITEELNKFSDIVLDFAGVSK